MAEIIDGKAVARRLDDKTKSEVDALVAAGGPRPGLAVVLVGHDPASEVYVRRKIKACEKEVLELVQEALAPRHREAQRLEKRHAARQRQHLGEAPLARLLQEPLHDPAADAPPGLVLAPRGSAPRPARDRAR